MSPSSSTTYPSATWKSTYFSLYPTQSLANKPSKTAVVIPNQMQSCLLMGGEAVTSRQGLQQNVSLSPATRFPLLQQRRATPPSFPEQFTPSYLLPKIWRAGYHVKNTNSAKRAAEQSEMSLMGRNKVSLLPVKPHLGNESTFPDYGFSWFSDLSTLLEFVLLWPLKATVFQLYYRYKCMLFYCTGSTNE